MRGPFGGSKGMGGGSSGAGGGGWMLRTVQRAVRTGVGGGAAQEPFSHSTTTTPTGRSTRNKLNSSNILSISSSTSSSPPFSSSINLPIPATSTSPTWPACSSPVHSDEFDWECVDGSDDDGVYGFYDDFVFGPVPSKDEVQHAVSAIQQVLDPASFSSFIKDELACNSDKDVGNQIASSSGLMHGVSSSGSDLDWIEPSLQLSNSKFLQPYSPNRVYDAFHLLQTEPSIQRMVISLSSDRAVWEAVLNNEVVRELRESLNEAENGVPKSSREGSVGSNGPIDILTWIFANTKAKLMEVVEKITKILNELFRPPEGKKNSEATDPFAEKLRTSFLLSVMVLLIVVVTRAHRASS